MGFQKIKIEPSCDPSTLFLGLCAREIKSAYPRDACTPAFSAALFNIAEIRYLLKRTEDIFILEIYS